MQPAEEGNERASDMNHSARAYCDQALALCMRSDFQRWLAVSDVVEAQVLVREMCGVRSLVEIRAGQKSGERWQRIAENYNNFTQAMQGMSDDRQAVGS